MKKILYISPFPIYPPTTGGERANLNYLMKLSGKNEIYVCLPKSQKDINLNNLHLVKIYENNKLKYINIFSYLQIYFLTRRLKLSEIVVSMPYQGYFALVIAKLVRGKIYVHTQNVEFLRFKRLEKLWWPFLYVYEFILYRFVDKILVISTKDKSDLIRYLKIDSNKIDYTPYYVDKNIFKPNQKTRLKVRLELNADKEFLVLFFGTLDYKPNTEAFKIIINEIAPKFLNKNKRIKFLIVGRNPPKYPVSKNVIVKGFVEKIEDYINACDLVIVPLLTGGGIRTKILESIACNKKVLSTSIGAEGITVDTNDNIIICDSWEGFNNHINKIANDAHHY